MRLPWGDQARVVTGPNGLVRITGEPLRSFVEEADLAGRELPVDVEDDVHPLMSARMLARLTSMMILRLFAIIRVLQYCRTRDVEFHIVQ